MNWKTQAPGGSMVIDERKRSAVRFANAPLPQPRSSQVPIRARALILGVILVVITAVLVTQAELVVTGGIHIGYLQFPPVALGLLLIVIAFNRGIATVARKFALSASDILVVYCMMLVGAMVSSHGMAQKICALLVTPNYFATPVNNWHGIFDPLIPRCLVPYDPRISGQQVVSSWYYNGIPHGEPIPWVAWMAPILNWCTLMFLVIGAYLCLATILRRQWIENEKLAFPLAQVPLELASGSEGERPFFKNPVMWVGAAIPTVLFGMKGLHQINPHVPDVLTPLAINTAITVPPWNQLTITPLTWSFAGIGFFYLLPSDVLFSIWFFFVLTRLEEVWMISYNQPMPGMPMYPVKAFTGYQSIGAYVVLVAYLYWIARPHLKRVWLSAIGKQKVDDSGEIMSYKAAFWGLMSCIIASSLWLRFVAGMSLWLAILEMFVLLFVIAIIMARSTAEAGLVMTETTFRPIDIYRMFGSMHALGPVNLTMLSFVDSLLMRDQRGLLLTGMLDSLRIADGTQIRRRSFAGVLILGILIAAIVAIGLNLAIPYRMGANQLDNWMENGSPNLAFNDYATYFPPMQQIDPNMHWQMPVFFVVGIAVCLFLTIMRSTFHWWPLHPLGYALAGSWTTVVFWFPCLIAWICKTLSIRYGGAGFYSKARPFFIGMILGEFGIAVIFAALNLLFHLPVPAFPWS